MASDVLVLTIGILFFMACYGWRKKSIDADVRWDILMEIVKRNPSIDIEAIKRKITDDYLKSRGLD